MKLGEERNWEEKRYCYRKVWEEVERFEKKRE